MKTIGFIISHKNEESHRDIVLDILNKNFNK